MPFGTFFFPPNRALAQCFHVASDSIEKHCPVIFFGHFLLMKKICKNTSASFAFLLLLKLETQKKNDQVAPYKASGSFFGSEM